MGERGPSLRKLFFILHPRLHWQIYSFSLHCVERRKKKREGKKNAFPRTNCLEAVCFLFSINTALESPSSSARDSRTLNASRIVYNIAGNLGKKKKKLYSSVPKVLKAISTLIKVVCANIIVSLSAELEALPSSKEFPPSFPPSFFPFYIFMYLSALLWICTLGPSCTRDNTNPVYVRYLGNITPLEILELQGVGAGGGGRECLWGEKETQRAREREHTFYIF